MPVYEVGREDGSVTRVIADSKAEASRKVRKPGELIRFVSEVKEELPPPEEPPEPEIPEEPPEPEIPEEPKVVTIPPTTTEIPVFGDILNWIIAQFKALADWLSTMFSTIIEPIKQTLSGAFSTILAPVTTAINWVEEKVSQVWSWLTQNIPSALETIRLKTQDIWGWVTSSLPAGISWLQVRVEGLFGELGGITGLIERQGKSLLEAVARILSSFFDPVCDGINAVFKGLTPELAPALAYNTPELRDEILSWWPQGTPLYDFINAGLKFIISLPRIIFDGLGGGIARILGEDVGPWLARWQNTLGIIADTSENLPQFINDEVVAPMVGGLRDLWDRLADILKAAFEKVWEAIKTFFTETLPHWFRGLWENLKAGLSWVWDKVVDVAEFFMEEIIKLVKKIAPISPEAGMGTLQGVVKVAMALAGGLGMMTLLGNLVHPIHSLGLEHVSAMVYDMTNYKVLIGAGMAVIATASIRTPLTYYFNSILRPNIPSEMTTAIMRSRQYIDFERYSQILSYYGYPDIWHEDMDRLTESRVGYFALAAVARNGVFDRDLFHRDLRRAGYAEEMITLLLNMYEKTSGEYVQGQMSGAAIKRFKEGFTTETQFHDELMLLGYGEPQWPVFLAAAKLDYAYDYLNDMVGVYRDAVRKGQMSTEAYRGALLHLGMVPEKVESYVLKEIVRLSPKELPIPIGPPEPEYETEVGKVKVDTLRRVRRKGLVTREQEIVNLLALGMPEGHAHAIADNDDARLAEKAEVD